MKTFKFKVENVEYDVIATYSDEMTGKSYMIYSDKTYSDGKINIYKSIYENNNGKITLLPVIDKIDQIIVDNLYDVAYKKIND